MLLNGGVGWDESASITRVNFCDRGRGEAPQVAKNWPLLPAKNFVKIPSCHESALCTHRPKKGCACAPVTASVSLIGISMSEFNAQKL